jgi:hypothetical protein
MAFFQGYESSPFKASLKNRAHRHHGTKHMKELHLFQPFLDFLTLVEEFFHLPSLVIDLEPSILIQSPTLKPLFIP